ncbi:hypothetical protein K2173_014205 [Erythroxylum novogranatense]|uniref:RecQ-mediated genome instability protein 2 n=1 Tax=Erythroxylum novogranatense TaxID=1862640 RepID=A0AAV8SE29_9ROSI|nr:hypothetical protein K2173_014205 [Erythroxylum novogranatense]
MDYSLAALKVFCVQLNDARQTPSQNAFTLGGILFQRAWLQGVLVSNEGRLLLDDSTGIIELSLAGEFLLRRWDIGIVPTTLWRISSHTLSVLITIDIFHLTRTGMYVMVVGGYFVRTGDKPMIKVHKMVDLSAFPDREAMWYLEVMEAYKLFYQPLIEDFM